MKKLAFLVHFNKIDWKIVKNDIQNNYQIEFKHKNKCKKEKTE